MDCLENLHSLRLFHGSSQKADPVNGTKSSKGVLGASMLGGG